MHYLILHVHETYFICLVYLLAAAAGSKDRNGIEGIDSKHDTGGDGMKNCMQSQMALIVSHTDIAIAMMAQCTCKRQTCSFAR